MGIEIRDYGKPINVDVTGLMPAIASMYPSPSAEFFTSWEFPEVGGKPGVIGIINKGGKTIKGVPIFPGFVAAYSPDGFDNQGTVVAIISVNADVKNFEEGKTVFENVVKDIRISKTG